VNIYRYGFKSPARNGDLKSMSFVHIATSTLVNGSFFCSNFFCFNNTNASDRSFIFSLLTTILYVYKGPLSKFQPGAPHNLNPPLIKVLSQFRTPYLYKFAWALNVLIGKPNFIKE